MATWLRKLATDGRPVVLTQRGRAAAVLVDPRVLDEIEESQEIVRKVARGLEDAAAGRVLSTATLRGELEAIIRRSESVNEG
jgi:prevent-host-death family protein